MTHLDGGLSKSIEQNKKNAKKKKKKNQQNLKKIKKKKVASSWQQPGCGCRPCCYHCYYYYNTKIIKYPCAQIGWRHGLTFWNCSSMEKLDFFNKFFFPCSSANKNKTHYVSRFKWDIFSIKFLLHFHPLIPYSPPPYPNLKHLQKLKPFIYIFQNHLDAVFALKLKILNYTYYRGITIVICSNLFLWKKIERTCCWINLKRSPCWINGSP